MIPLTEFGKLSPAEDKLIRWLQSRDRRTCVIDGAVPDTATPEVTLRASLVRELALGKVDGVPLPETGLRVHGAWIAGDGPEGAETRGLDLEGCSLPADLSFFDCRFPDQVLLRRAAASSIFLNGSHLEEGLAADDLQAEGTVFLREVNAVGEVRMLGSQLGGDLDCKGARFRAKSDGRALSLDRMNAKGGVFLNEVRANGTVRLLGARLGGNLSCTDAQFIANGSHRALSADGLQTDGDVLLRRVRATGMVRLLGVRLGGDLDCEGASFSANDESYTLSAERAKVAGAFFLRNGARVGGILSLLAAEFGSINDDPACWPRQGNLQLDRCRYGAFVGAPVDATSRIRWLGLQDAGRYGQDFWPQPYEECARVLRESGHSGAARAVLIEKERLQRAAKRARVARDLAKAQEARATAQPVSGYRPHTDRVIGHWLHWFFLSLWDGIVGTVIGYGRKPQNAFLWLGMLWLVGAVIFGVAGGHGAIKPNDPKIQIEPIWKDCHASPDHPTQYACFMDKAQVTGYPAFNALVYSADTLIPVISFEMQAYWLPDDRAPYGAFARVFLWFQIVAGWGLTLLAVAGFSGLVKQDSK